MRKADPQQQRPELRFILEEETNCIARVICRVFLTDLIRRRMSRRLAIYFRVKDEKNKAIKRRTQSSTLQVMTLTLLRIHH